MGVSTDAILAFGFDLGEELPQSLTSIDPEGEEEENYFEFEEWVVKRLGAEKLDYPERYAAIASFPIDLITHCSYDYPMYFVSVRGTEKKARRGYPEPIETSEVPVDKIQAMRDFCTEFGIEWKEPSWQIFSLWG